MTSDLTSAARKRNWKNYKSEQKARKKVNSSADESATFSSFRSEPGSSLRSTRPWRTTTTRTSGLRSSLRAGRPRTQCKRKNNKWLGKIYSRLWWTKGIQCFNSVILLTTARPSPTSSWRTPQISSLKMYPYIIVIKSIIILNFFVKKWTQVFC